MKVCFVGACGHWKQALACLKERQDVVFTGFAPGSKEEKQAESIDSAIPYFDDYRQMLDITAPDLAIVSPVFNRTGQVVLDCAKRKIDVFAEKPVAASVEELERLETAIKENGIRFCAMHYLRYAPSFYHGAKLVRSGAVGNVKLVTAQKSYKFGTRPAWYSDPDCYGSTATWVGIHAMDWVYAFTGLSFTSVTAVSDGCTPERAMLCQFTLAGGAVASVNLDYYRPATAASHGDDRIRCVGDRGVIEVCENQITLINGDGTQILCPENAPELLSEFLAGNDPIPLSEIIHITKAAIAARESAAIAETVMI